MSEAIHDFSAKLRQPSLRKPVTDYLRWRRSLARARAAGAPDPAPPEQAPISINLDLTTACNYRCDHCIDWEILNSGHQHDDARLRGSIETLRERGLRSVILIGGGEPTLYPGFASFVGFLKAQGLQTAIVSNGGRGDRLLEAAEHLEEGDWLRLSLDAASNELFSAMHRPASKSLTLDGICKWIPRIKACNPSFEIGYSYVIVWQGASRDDVPILENIHEIAAATERAKRYGFDYISLKPVLERGEDGAEIMDPEATKHSLTSVIARIHEQVEAAQLLADERFSVRVSTNLRVLEEGSWQELRNQPRVCHMQALRQVLTPMGTYNCPAHRGVDKAKLGGADAWSDDAMAGLTAGQLADLIDRFDASVECRHVTCLYNSVNWWLEKQIEQPTDAIDIEAGEERLDSFL